MSAQIRQERTSYYGVLEETQKGSVDITRWLQWFIGCFGRALDGTEVTLAAVLRKARFWERHTVDVLNMRHRLMLIRLLAVRGESRNSIRTDRI